MYILGLLYKSNIIFVRQGADGKVFIKKWYEYTSSDPSVKTYILFWGPKELIVMREKKYSIHYHELPADLRTILDDSAPDPIVIPSVPQAQPNSEMSEAMSEDIPEAIPGPNLEAIPETNLEEIEDITEQQ